VITVITRHILILTKLRNSSTLNTLALLQTKNWLIYCVLKIVQYCIFLMLWCTVKSCWI